MKLIKTIGSLCICLGALSLCHAKEIVKVEKKLPYSKGLNFSNWLEPIPGFIDGNFANYSKQDFIDIKNMGVEVLRIPTHFDTLSKGKPDYIIPEALWNKLDSAVDWCEELGMYVIIDFHNDCAGDSKTPPDIENRLTKIWPQIAQRYKDRSQYVIYEVMNEPHGIDFKKWGIIQGKMIKLIRSIDKTHSIIVGAADWNSIHELLNLPKYDDDNLIYNYHEYSPFLFTHQGAEWTDIKRLTHIPFPYVKEKMPKIPADATDVEKWNFAEYEKNASEDVLVAPLDKAVAFVNKRHAALMSNEFGVYMKYADVKERANWYRIKSGYMDDRNITRVSWDYKGGFGVFNRWDGGVFPQDLNKEVVKAMGYKIPSYKSTTWFEDAVKNNDYTIYKNGIAPKITFSSWIPESENKAALYKDESGSNELFIYVPKADSYRQLEFMFNDEVDLTALKNKGACLEFEIRIMDPDCKLQIYFKDSVEKGIPWRCGAFLENFNVKSDGKWHKVSIPLKNFADYGAWDGTSNQWFNSTNSFDWKIISSLVFDTSSPITRGLSLKNIIIR